MKRRSFLKALLAIPFMVSAMGFSRSRRSISPCQHTRKEWTPERTLACADCGEVVTFRQHGEWFRYAETTDDLCPHWNIAYRVHDSAGSIAECTRCHQHWLCDSPQIASAREKALREVLDRVGTQHRRMLAKMPTSNPKLFT